jgi:hypothetical protein
MFTTKDIERAYREGFKDGWEVHEIMYDTLGENDSSEQFVEGNWEVSTAKLITDPE